MYPWSSRRPDRFPRDPGPALVSGAWPNEPTSAQISAWATAAGAGDRDALAAFVRATQRDVHRFVAHLSSAREADDLAQETYLRALRALPGFAGRSSARTWLLSIARHTAADAVRAAVRRPRTTGVEDWEALGARGGLVRTAVDEGVLLRALIAELDPDRREAFVLTQVLDLSYAEAADVCDCPIGTIRSRVARAREDLVEAMDARPTSRARRAGGG
jgi:RNA polymerase sigma-70 factor (ECF subfamily)